MTYKLSTIAIPLIELNDKQHLEMEFAVRLRLSVEFFIVTKLIDVILAAGNRISVFDGEVTCLSHTDDRAAILEAIMSSDEDRLIVVGKNRQPVGSIHLIYGNDGHDVIHDYSIACEDWVKAVEKELGL